MPTKVDVNKVMEEVDSFKTEYPAYDDETISDYIKLLDDFSPAEKTLFIRKLGY